MQQQKDSERVHIKDFGRFPVCLQIILNVQMKNANFLLKNRYTASAKRHADWYYVRLFVNVHWHIRDK